MAVIQVLIYPHPLLKQVASRVEELDGKLLSFITDLNETLDDAPGCVGIAAPQVGVGKRIIIVDASRLAKPVPNHGRMVMINPEIEWREGEVVAREGCLSIPDYTANVRRARAIRVRFTRVDGSEEVIETSDFEARVVLHEYDHLDGLLFLDRVDSLKTDVFRRKRYGGVGGAAQGPVAAREKEI